MESTHRKTPKSFSNGQEETGIRLLTISTLMALLWEGKRGNVWGGLGPLLPSGTGGGMTPPLPLGKRTQYNSLEIFECFKKKARTVFSGVFYHLYKTDDKNILFLLQSAGEEFFWGFQGAPLS